MDTLLHRHAVAHRRHRLRALPDDLLKNHTHAWPQNFDGDVMLPNPGDYHYRNDGEAHYNTPQGHVGAAGGCAHQLAPGV